MVQPIRPRRFAPLDPAKKKDRGGDERPVLRGIVFDVDGTLCKLFLGLCLGAFLWNVSRCVISLGARMYLLICYGAIGHPWQRHHIFLHFIVWIMLMFYNLTGEPQNYMFGEMR